MLIDTVAGLARQTLTALRFLVVMTLVLGVAYPLAVWGAGQTFGDRADGSPVTLDGDVVGSSLLGQPFEGDEWFLPRPSTNDYDTSASAPSNLGPSSEELVATIEQRRQDVARAERVDPAEVPPDAVTASASGLDPHVSPEYAALQAPRVAAANGLDVATVEDLVAEHTDEPFLGFHGEHAVNVLELNLAVVEAAAAGAGG